MVDDQNRAVITDFGLAVYVNAYSNEFFSMRDGHYKWVAPEGLGAGGVARASVRPTPQMDVWSFAHVCAEVRSCVYQLGYNPKRESSSTRTKIPFIPSPSRKYQLTFGDPHQLHLIRPQSSQYEEYPQNCRKWQEHYGIY